MQRKTWTRQQVIFQEAGILVYMGPVFEDRTTRTIFVSFWKIPGKVLDDTGYFKTHAANGGGFFLLKSTDGSNSKILLKILSQPIGFGPKF